MKNNTAILIFARTAQAEAKAKQWLPGKKSNILLANSFLKQTCTIVKKTGIPHFLFTEKQQQGSSFENKLYNACQTVFNNNYSNIIVIGADSPALQTQHLQNAYTAVNNNQVVIGPDKRGGIYLWAFNKQYCTQQLFVQLPFQTNGLYTALVSIFANQQCITYILPTVADVHQSLLKHNYFQLQYFIGKALFNAIASLIASYIKNVHHLFISTALQLQQHKGLRAPPTVPFF